MTQKNFNKDYILNEDGSMTPTRELRAALFRKFLAPVMAGGDVRFVPTTPLLARLKAKKSTLIVGSEGSIRCHIFSALMQNKDLELKYKLLSPNEIMARLAGSTEDQFLLELHQCDLLIVMAESFPQYVKAFQFHNDLFNTRAIHGRPTWFCTSNLDRVTMGDVARSDPSFSDRLTRMAKKDIIRFGKAQATVAASTPSTPVPVTMGDSVRLSYGSIGAQPDSAIQKEKAKARKTAKKSETTKGEPGVKE